MDPRCRPGAPRRELRKTSLLPATHMSVTGGAITRRVDFALFMVEALENDELVHEAPAIVGCQTPSALAHAAGK